jgi:hypothetical protein
MVACRDSPDGQIKRKRIIGASLLKEIEPHPLLGLGYCQEWVNVKGTKTAIYGTITKVVEKGDVGEEEKFTVTYTDESRNLVNSTYTECGSLHTSSCSHLFRFA